MYNELSSSSGAGRAGRSFSLCKIRRQEAEIVPTFFCIIAYTRLPCNRLFRYDVGIILQSGDFLTV